MQIDTFLHAMVRKGASDLFITSGSVPSVKIHGILEKFNHEVLSPSEARELVYSIMSGTQQVEFEVTHECNFALQREGRIALLAGLCLQLRSQL